MGIDKSLELALSNVKEMHLYKKVLQVIDPVVSLDAFIH